jgi:hypothetical protein
MTKNKNSFFFLILLMSLAIASCQSNLTQSTNTPYDGPAPELNLGKPETAFWKLAEDSTLQVGRSSIAIQAIYLNGQETMLFFTLSGIGFDEFTPGIPIQVTDQEGYSSKLLKVVPFGKVGNLSAGMMVFEPRRLGGQTLTLRWTAKNGSSQAEKLIASFTKEAYRDYAYRTYFSAQDRPIEQNGYRISMRWALTPADQKEAVPAEIVPPGTRVGGVKQTPTPAIPRTPTLVTRNPLTKLPPGVSILQECSLIFEEVEDHRVETINVQVLDNANAIVQSAKSVSIPQPIIIYEIVPTSINPYP